MRGAFGADVSILYREGPGQERILLVFSLSRALLGFSASLRLRASFPSRPFQQPHRVPQTPAQEGPSPPGDGILTLTSGPALHVCLLRAQCSAEGQWDLMVGAEVLGSRKHRYPRHSFPSPSAWQLSNHEVVDLRRAHKVWKCGFIPFLRNSPATQHSWVLPLPLLVLAKSQELNKMFT